MVSGIALVLGLRTSMHDPHAYVDPTRRKTFCLQVLVCKPFEPSMSHGQNSVKEGYINVGII